MPSLPSRHILPDVPRLEFGPQSDVYTSAVARVLEFVGEKDAPYHDLLGASGRGFKVCWDNRMFYWDRFGKQPVGDPERYLRLDFATLAAVPAAAGHTAEVLLNTHCHRPQTAAGDARPVSAGQMRDALMRALAETNVPVLALMSLSSTEWTPEWSLITGYDGNGDVLTGWSCFQNDPAHKQGIVFEPNGYFRRQAWEKDVVALVRIDRERNEERRKTAHGRQMLEQAIALSQGCRRGEEAWGLDACDAWAAAMLDEGNGSLSDEVLKGRMEYHIRFVGHFAAQKWYSGEFLSSLDRTPWTKSGLLHAAACYAREHELMWECWRVGGGYWRDIAKELPKLREQTARARIAGFIREAQAEDREAVKQLGLALANWGKSHGSYMD